MSFARFSSDDWQSDVYVYESNFGYEVHLAANRVPVDTSSLPPFFAPIPGDEASWEAFVERHLALIRLLHDNDHLRYDLNLPHAGESFCYATPGECAIALLEFQVLGFHVPPGCIEDLQEEDRERVQGQQDQARDDIGVRPAPEEG